MTELLSRRPTDGPESFSDEEAPLFDMADFEADVQEPKPELSPTATRLRAAAERAATFLDDRAETKLQKTEQDEAYGSYSENISATRDRIREERIDAVEAKIENAKARIGGLGRTTLGRLKNAGLITVGLSLMASEAGVRGVKRGSEAVSSAAINGLGKVEVGMSTAGNKIADTKASVKDRYQTYQFNKESKSNQKQFQKEYAKQTKAFDKEAARDRKLQTKVDKWESKAAAKYDRRFEREMRKKAALEHRAERRELWASRFNTVKEAVASVPERAGNHMMAGFAKIETGIDRTGRSIVNAKERAGDKVERVKVSAHTTRAAGRAALEAFKAARQVHDEQNKLY